MKDAVKKKYRSYFYAENYSMINICKYRSSEKDSVEYILSIDGKKHHMSEEMLVLVKDVIIECFLDGDELEDK